MRETALLIAQFALTYAAFLALALTQVSQISRLVGPANRRSMPTNIMRILGAVLLISAAALAMVHYGRAFGLLFWLESLFVSGVLVALTFARAPAWLRWLVIRKE